MMAAKFLKDDYFDNEYYAKVAGVTLREINELEIDFLLTIEFKLYIPELLYEAASKIVPCETWEPAAKPSDNAPTCAQPAQKGLFECIKGLKGALGKKEQKGEAVAGL